jgi:hypothetical protein
MKIKKKCLMCNGEFVSTSYRGKVGRGKFCSPKCSQVWHSGKNNPNWQGGNKKKICLICGKEFFAKPKLNGKVWGLFCSVRCHGSWKSKNESGKNHWNWQGGITPVHAKIRGSMDFRLWRESVFARDGWTCQECGKKASGHLNAHHIKPFATHPELRLEVSNGITLCEKCHNKKPKGKEILKNIRRLKGGV